MGTAEADFERLRIMAVGIAAARPSVHGCAASEDGMSHAVFVREKDDEFVQGAYLSHARLCSAECGCPVRARVCYTKLTLGNVSSVTSPRFVDHGSAP